MISNLLKMLSYPFMQRALVVGILVSLCAALLGVSLVLKRYSMIGDGLSHVGFGSLAIAAALGFAPLAFTIPVVVLAAFLLLRMNESSKIKGRHRPDFKLCACDRCHHGFVVERHEHRCQQLHVRKHPCDE